MVKVSGLTFKFYLADKKSKERSSSVGQKKDKKVMELKATMKMYHDELEEAVSFRPSTHFNVSDRPLEGLIRVPRPAAI